MARVERTLISICKVERHRERDREGGRKRLEYQHPQPPPPGSTTARVNRAALDTDTMAAQCHRRPKSRPVNFQ